MGMNRVFCLLMTVLILTADYTAKADEQFEFKAEVGRLMDIIINSLYTQK